jgi:hypothetical protein
MSSGTTTISVSALGFFSVLLILTLNASNGKDVLDVWVPYIEAKTEALTNDKRSD